MTRKKNNSKQKAAAKAVKKPAAPQAQEPRRNIFKIESELFAKKYTNERIYKQIDNDSCLFFTILGMLIFAAAIITASFVNAYKFQYDEKYQKKVLKRNSKKSELK